MSATRTRAAMNDALGTLERSNDQRYARVPTHDFLDVTTVITNSNNSIEYALATIDGKGQYKVRPGGQAVSVGDRVLGKRIGNEPFGAEYELVQLVASVNPYGTTLRVNANLPVPAFDATPFTTALITSGGMISASMTIRLVQLEEKYAITTYKVSWRLTGTTNWQDIHLPHIPGQVQGICAISTSLKPGQQVDVKLAAEASWAQQASPDSAVSTFTAATDTNSPVTLNTITVNTGVPGALAITLGYSSMNPDYFLDWEYNVATSPTGAGLQTYYSKSDTFVYGAGAPGTSYYVAVRARAKNGSFGNRIPSTAGTYQGPYAFAVATAPPDTTPPAAFGSAPTLSNQSYTDDRFVTHGVVRVTLPAYSFAGDYLGTEVLFSSSEGRSDVRWIDGTGTTKDFEVGFSALWTVSLRGVDLLGNRQSTFGPTATLTVPIPGIPATPGSAPVVTQRAMALLVTWVMPSGATQIILERADNAGMTTNLKNLGTLDGTMFLDLEDGLNGVPPYPTRFYRFRGVNNSGPGSNSPVSTGTAVLKLDGRNIVADTITAVEIAAATITGTELNANIVLASLIKTAASGARWEIEGHTGSGTQDQVRFYSASALKLTITSSSLTYFGDGGQSDISLGTASARGFLQLPGVKFSPFSADFDLSGTLTNNIRFFDSGDVNCEYRMKSSATIGGGNLVACLIGDSANSRGFAIGLGTTFSPTMNSGYLMFQGYTLLAGQSGSPDRRFYRTGSFGGVAGSWTIDNSLGTFNVGLQTSDFLTHRGNNTGVVYFGNSVSSYIYFDGATFNTTNGWAFSGHNLSGINDVSTGSVTATSTIYTTGVMRQGVGSLTTAGYNCWNGDLPASAGAVTGYNFHAKAQSSNQLELQTFFYRFQGTSSWPGTVHVIRFAVDGTNFVGGSVILGSTTAGVYYWGIGANVTADLFWSNLNNRIESVKNFNVQGTLTKAAGTFRIPHPDPAKTDKLDLRHSFVESPTRGDNLYRFPVALADADATKVGDRQLYRTTLALPDYFQYLNEPPDCAVWAQDGFGRGFATANPELTALVVTTDAPGQYVVIAVATRKDKAAVEHWDGEGGIEIPKALPEPTVNPAPPSVPSGDQLYLAPESRARALAEDTARRKRDAAVPEPGAGRRMQP